MTFIARAKSARSARCCQYSISDWSSGLGTTVQSPQLISSAYTAQAKIIGPTDIYTCNKVYFVRHKLLKYHTLRLLYSFMLLSGVSPEAAM